MKLTQDKRRTIARRARDHATDARVEQLRKDEEALALRIYEFRYEDIAARMNDLPDGWLPVTNTMRVASDRSNGLEVSQLFPLRSVKRIPMHPSDARRFAMNHKLREEAIRLRAEQESITQDRKDIYDQTLSLLKSVTTLKRLKEVWPDGSQFYEDLEGPGNLPSIPVADLNAKLGIGGK